MAKVFDNRDLCFNQGMLGLGYSNSLCAVMNHDFEKLGKSTNQINHFYLIQVRVGLHNRSLNSIGKTNKIYGQ